MCFKDKHYYSNKIKEFFGMFALAIMFDLFILLSFIMA